MQPDATLHHEAFRKSATVHWCTPLPWLCVSQANKPGGGMTFYKVVVFSPGSMGPTSELCAYCSMSTTRMVLNMCTLFFKVRCQDSDLTLESTPYTHSTTFAFCTVASAATGTATPSHHHPCPPFPWSDGGTEIQAEAASVCLCEGTI